MCIVLCTYWMYGYICAMSNTNNGEIKPKQKHDQKRGKPSNNDDDDDVDTKATRCSHLFVYVIVNNLRTLSFTFYTTLV